MIRISLNREPVEEPLRGAFAGCTVTFRRLTSNEFAEAHAAAQAIVKDSSRLVELLEEYDLRRDGQKIKAALADVQFMMGIGEWIGAVECGIRAISAWSGFFDDDGQPIPVPGPKASAEEKARFRRVLEVCFLSKPFMDQVLPRIDAAAQLLAVEGKDFGASLSGSPAPAPTASAPTTAKTAGSAPSRAPTASPASPAASAPRSKTPRSRRKAPPSGD